MNEALVEEVRRGPLGGAHFGRPTLTIDRKLIGETRRRCCSAIMDESASELVLAEPGFVAAYTRAELESGSARGRRYFDQMERSWNADARATWRSR